MTEITYGKAKLTDALRISIFLKTMYIQTYVIDGVSFEFANYIITRFSPEHIEQLIEETYLLPIKTKIRLVWPSSYITARALNVPLLVQS